MNKVKVVVSKISDNLTKNGNKIISIKSKDSGLVEIAPGIHKSKSLTYFMAVNGNTTATVGQEFELDLDLFEIKERAFDTVDETTQEPITLMLKWLHLK
jgi:hypothetical protein